MNRKPELDGGVPAGPVRAAPSRRRFIAIVGATSTAAILQAGSTEAAPELFRWHGRVLGATASLAIAGLPKARAQRLAELCHQEVRRLEGVFSLYQPDSALSRLNADGGLEAPPPALRSLLALAAVIQRQSGGGFDPTVQPLWKLYADHFIAYPDSRSGPASEDVDRVRAAVGWHHVRIDATSIAFARPGMAITLNGLAQGYISDRVADLLRQGGVRHALVDLGEINAIGNHPTGRTWRVGLLPPGTTRRPSTAVPVVDAAVATSGHHGSHFDIPGRFSHILDPRTGRPSTRPGNVSVVAGSAALADGLSTAALTLTDDGIRRMLGTFPASVAYRTERDGSVRRLTATPA